MLSFSVAPLCKQSCFSSPPSRCLKSMFSVWSRVSCLGPRRMLPHNPCLPATNGRHCRHASIMFVSGSHFEQSKQVRIRAIVVPPKKSGIVFGTDLDHVQVKIPSLIGWQLLRCFSSSRSTTRSSLGDSADDCSSLASEVVHTTRTIDVMVDSIPEQDVIKFVSELSRLGCTDVEIRRLLGGRLWLLRDRDAVMSAVRLLKQHGLGQSVSLKLLENLPALYWEDRSAVRNLPVLLNASITQLRTLGIFSEKRMVKLLKKDPALLLLLSGSSSASILEKFAKLKGLFTVSDVRSIVEKCPNVLTDDWADTREKFDYAFFTMGYHQDHIARSRLFSHPLEHIQDRHLFLSRAGFFLTVKKKVDPKLNPNPCLREVVDAHDEDFVSLCTGGKVGLEHYAVFPVMRQVEREEGDGRDHLDSSDSDDEREWGQ
ncbi:uncharacterized protein LOC101854783 [Aplysia californica]|uniref:Uncharacterized protein LOC101854783 n=1 Tax=Aplysia californica TaxID=6500 RepID=A0ABM0JJ84_APLCA|nr:uncharacterized protein LOC101854783 [Aplysia californica]